MSAGPAPLRIAPWRMRAIARELVADLVDAELGHGSFNAGKIASCLAGSDWEPEDEAALRARVTEDHVIALERAVQDISASIIGRGRLARLGPKGGRGGHRAR